MNRKQKRLVNLLVSLLSYVLLAIWIATLVVVPITLTAVCINWLYTIF